MFLVKNLRASRVNLLMNDFAAGLPSPLAFLGLAAAIAPALGKARWERRPPATRRWEIGVLPILHRVDVSEGRTKAELSNDAGAFTPVEIPEDLTGSVTVSVLLDIPDCIDEHLIGQALLGRRMAGGPIHNAEITAAAVTADGTAFRGVDRGYAMIRTEPPKSAVVATGQIDHLKALAAELYRRSRARLACARCSRTPAAGRSCHGSKARQYAGSAYPACVRRAGRRHRRTRLGAQQAVDRPRRRRTA